MGEKPLLARSEPPGQGGGGRASILGLDERSGDQWEPQKQSVAVSGSTAMVDGVPVDFSGLSPVTADAALVVTGPKAGVVRSR